MNPKKCKFSAEINNVLLEKIYVLLIVNDLGLHLTSNCKCQVNMFYGYNNKC